MREEDLSWSLEGKKNNANADMEKVFVFDAVM